MPPPAPAPSPLDTAPVPVAALDRESSYPVAIRPGAEFRGALARDLGLEALTGLALIGTLAAEGTRGWRFEGRLTASVAQSCVVTLAPVESRIDEPVARVWLPEGDIAPTDGDLAPEGPDGPDPLGESIDLEAVIGEALALAIDPWPRAPGVEPVDRSFGPAGAEPLTGDAARPFAPLAALRARIGGDGDGDDG